MARDVLERLKDKLGGEITEDILKTIEFVIGKRKECQRMNFTLD
ncbi:MAG: hypothetical protein AB1567_02380 [bacterium]